MRNKRHLATVLYLLIGILFSACGTEKDDFMDNFYDDEQESTSDTDNIDKRDPKIKELIANHVSVKADYSDYMWHFTIESTLHHELSGQKIQFGIGHGIVNDDELISVEDDAYNYTSSNNGRRKTFTFTNPFWFYYGFGIDPYDPDTWGKCQLYYGSYCYLKDKGINNLDKDEKTFYDHLISLLNDYERETRWAYRPSVQVLIDSKSYVVSRYKLN